MCFLVGFEIFRGGKTPWWRLIPIQFSPVTFEMIISSPGFCLHAPALFPMNYKPTNTVSSGKRCWQKSQPRCPENTWLSQVTSAKMSQNSWKAMQMSLHLFEQPTPTEMLSPPLLGVHTLKGGRCKSILYGRVTSQHPPYNTSWVLLLRVWDSNCKCRSTSRKHREFLQLQ